MRAFIAFEIPREIQQAIYKTTSPLRAELNRCVRWTPPENIHLTLKFLGEIPPAQVDALTSALRVQADSVPAFNVEVGGLGSFPDRKRARVLWIGIQAPAEIQTLQRGIESACARLGYESESRGFSPHLTIGRVRQQATPADAQKIRRALEAATIDSLGAVRVDLVHLFKSDLQKSGAVYTKIFSAPLKAVAPT
ncbi:MAG: RNA 2',3'-cyclic phosphodiesterase [Anaerolineales bacterium]|nr:MAG: RNA 2',3'-cyclic phosphodiesterase [Anaerolineales bacterium]